MSKRSRHSAAIFALAVLAIPAVHAFGGQTDVHVHLLKIPRVQSWDAKLSDGNGGIDSIRTEGDVTALFPDGIVWLKTELSPAASESAIAQVIRDRLSFGNARAGASRVSIEGLKTVIVRLDDSRPAEEIRFERKRAPHSSEGYRIKAGLKSVAEDGIVLDIDFDAGWSSWGGRLGSGVIGRIFHETVAVPLNKILLIGFPAHDEGPRGSIYWLAIGAMGNSESVGLRS